MRGSTKLVTDLLQRTPGTVQDLVVPEPQDTIPAGRKNGTASLIADQLISMLTAIDLDDQSGIETDEIDDMRTDHLLPPKLESVQLTGSQVPPQQAFCVGGFPTQRAGTRQQ